MKVKKALNQDLLAHANRGYLYIDEVNLLEDHIVDLLLDVAVSGENLIEREGLSVKHDSKICTNWFRKPRRRRIKTTAS